MTVKELIKQLNTLPSDFEVFLESTDDPTRAVMVRSAVMNLAHKRDRTLIPDAVEEIDASEYFDCVTIQWSLGPGEGPSQVWVEER